MFVLIDTLITSIGKALSKPNYVVGLTTCTIGLAAKFKANCAEVGVSMASIFKSATEDYLAIRN